MNPIHICLFMRTGEQWMGGVYYTQNLVRALDYLPVEQRAKIKLTIAASASDRERIELVRQKADHLYLMRVWDSYLFRFSRLLSRTLTFLPAGYFNYKGFDFVYPDFAIGRAPYLWGNWIPDFQHHHLPEFFSDEEVAARNARFHRNAMYAPVIVLSSRMAQSDFQNFYPEAAQRSRVLSFASCALDEWFELDPEKIQRKYNLPERFFLLSNQFWAHKNHMLVVDALALLKKRGIEPVVVCTGITQDLRHPEYFPALETKILGLDLETQFRILGLIPRIEQIQLMRRCLAVLQPSLFEGWSTVVEDAKAIGRPIFLSDFPVHIEQNPPGASYFERRNEHQLANLLADGWQSLSPGPDFESETKARMMNREHMEVYGKRFIEIVEQTISSTDN